MTGRRCLNCAASMPEHMRSDAQHCCRACLRATYRKRLLENPPVIGVEVEDEHDEVIGFLNVLGKAMADKSRRFAVMDELARETMAMGMYDDQEAS